MSYIICSFRLNFNYFALRKKEGGGGGGGRGDLVECTEWNTHIQRIYFYS